MSNKPLQIGQHLFTKDGRKVGNALIVGMKDDLFQIETDFGNGGSWLSRQEIDGWWHTEGLQMGHPMISSVERWRSDRLELLAMKKFITDPNDQG